ncbi:hypothetical protein DL89DRAFT_263952 [Linderina pennispora]|uniref:Uncharacterized protein n=1 Tax=Linderina pennispora TaxID=61395 RepID=A0A1Y1WKP1_9FUNG|nr:uncharacterized protein DL89DRAFT_263952 [Linderina pennispora]ORX73945.1 hypothetical protein DL89DRAFT_263952 [Linderina pennispora]
MWQGVCHRASSTQVMVVWLAIAGSSRAIGGRVSSETLQEPCLSGTAGGMRPQKEPSAISL